MHRAKIAQKRVRMEGWRQVAARLEDKELTGRKKKNRLDTHRPSHGRTLARTLCASLHNLVLATRTQYRQDHQVRQRKQPQIGLLPRCLICACDKAEVPPARQTVEMLQADPGQGGSLRVRKDLLARLDLDHAFAPQIIHLVPIQNALLKAQNHSSAFPHRPRSGFQSDNALSIPATAKLAMGRIQLALRQRAGSQ